MLCEQLRDTVSIVKRIVEALDADRLRADSASELVETFAELERLASAGRTIAGRSVEKSPLWSQEGYRTPARWMAARAQTTLAAAITTIETGRALERLPTTRESFQSGALSGLQAAEIAKAASADPAAEGPLLEAAKTESVAGLRERCREVIAAASPDGDADERIHRSRYFRHWTDAEGAVRVDGRFTPDAGARLVASVQARSGLLIEQARRSGSNERREAYAADALVALVGGTEPATHATVHVHVDEKAWSRGRVEKGETCRISGIGPISVAAARRLAEEGIVKTVLSDGADVTSVAHLGRTIPARLRSALEARDQTCVVPGCDERDGLEIDHVVPMADGGPTRLDNLARLCRFHHGLKTHRGWRLAGRPGRWEWNRGPPRVRS